VVRADFRDWIRDDYPRVDVCHVDLIHTYQPTYEALRWAVAHSDLTIAHDTDAYADVRRACADVAVENGLRFYNWPEFHGLGILTRREPQL